MKELTTANIVDELVKHPASYEPPTKHYFLDGMYCREMFVHEGTLAVGATHTTSCFNLLTEGTIVVGNGDEAVELKAPQVFVSGPGVQKVGLAITDVVWVNVFRTDATTVEEAEQELFSENLESYKARMDYNKMLLEYNLTEDIVQQYVQIDNVIQTELEGVDYIVKESEILPGEMGVFTKKSYSKGCSIDKAIVGNYRTALGRYVNHSPNKNAQIIGNNVIAIKDIKEGQEILFDYRDSLKGYICRQR